MTGHCCSRSRPTRDHLPPPRPEASDRTFAKRPSFPHRTDLGARPTPADQGREPQGFESRSIFILSAPSEIFLTLCANGRLDRLRKLVRFGPPVRCRPVTHLDDRGAFTVSTGPYALGLCGSCSLETARRGPERTTKLRWETCGKKRTPEGQPGPSARPAQRPRENPRIVPPAKDRAAKKAITLRSPRRRPALRWGKQCFESHRGDCRAGRTGNETPPTG